METYFCQHSGRRCPSSMEAQELPLLSLSNQTVLDYLIRN